MTGWALAVLVSASSAASAPVRLEAGWQYRYGRDDRTSEAWSAPGWSDYRLPGYLPRTPESDSDSWVRVQLPAGEWLQPALKLDGVMGKFEAYLDGHRLYAYPAGGVDQQGLNGIPWFLIDLPADAGGKTFSIHLRANYPLAGVRNVPVMGQRGDLLEAVVRNDTPRFLIGCLMLALALFAAAVLVPANAGRLALGFALFAAGTGVYVVHYTQLKQLVMNVPPTVWLVAWAIALPMIPIGLLRFVEAVFLDQPLRAVRRMRWLHERYGALYLAVSIACGVAIEVFGDSADKRASVIFFIVSSGLRLLMLASAAVLLFEFVRIGRRGGPSARKAWLLLAGYSAVVAGSMRDIGAAFGVWGLGRTSDLHWGLLALTVCLLLIIQRVYTELQERALAQARELALRSKEKETMLRDLHDGIGGVTTNIRLLAELGRRNASRANDALSAIAELSTEGLADLRAFTQTLDDTSVTWGQLVAELRRYGGQLIEAQGMRFDLAATLPADGKPGGVLCLAVLRIFREALTNVVKHAGAQTVNAVLSLEGDRFTLELADDGAGGGPGGGLDTGRGLKNMRSRAEELGGTLAVSTEQGTRLVLVLPVAGPSP